MFTGKLLAIGITAKEGQPVQLVAEAAALAGRGLAGDRYASKNKPENAITLIEAEALAAAASEYQSELSHAESRRNLLTENVPLNHLVGKEFYVGEVKLRGVELCEPCSHLEKLCEKKVRRSLIHRGGLRAEILTSGTIAVGDIVRVG